VIAGGDGTSKENMEVWDFDSGATEEILDFPCRLVGYDGGGLTFRFPWTSEATSGDCIWQAAIRRLNDDAEDYDTTDHVYAYNTTTVTTASAARELDYAVITFTNGSDMDSLENGECFILRISRNSSAGGDTLNSNDAELWVDMLLGEET
jgi:hypothetical protein